MLGNLGNDIRIFITAETRQAQQAFTGLFQKFGEFAFHANNIVYWGKMVFGALEDVYKVALEGAKAIGGEVADAYEAFDAGLQKTEASLQSMVTRALLPAIEWQNRLWEATDRLDQALADAVITQDQYTAARHAGIDAEGDWQALAPAVNASIRDNASAADQAALALGRMNEAALELGKIAEGEFDGGIGAGLSNINAALITAEGRLDNVEAGFRELGVSGAEADLALIRVQAAQGLLNAEQEESARLMLALGVLIRDGLIVDYDDLAQALIDGKLSQEEFASLLGETGEAAGLAAEEVEFLATQAERLDGSYHADITIKVTGADLLAAAADDLAAMQDAHQGINYNAPPPPSYDASESGGGKAVGGPVSPDVPYWVGEHGPEMFVPDRAGTILPTNHNYGSITINVSGADDPEAVARAVAAELGALANRARSSGAVYTGM